MFEVIAFDADDTLWHNEHNFTNIQDRFCEMLNSHDPELVKRNLSDLHVRNIEIFGYGVKGFILSILETFLEIRDGKVEGREIRQILEFGRDMLDAPIELLPDVSDVIFELSQEYTLMLITKGDLIDQEKKILHSGLLDFFKGIEIVSDKTEEAYKIILKRYKIDYSRFLMVGNSMRSDIVPVVQIGAHAVYIPYQSTWEHEKDHPHLDIGKYSVLENIGLLPKFLKGN